MISRFNFAKIPWILKKIYENVANLEGPLSVSVVLKDSIETWIVYWYSWNSLFKFKLHEIDQTSARAIFSLDIMYRGKLDIGYE